MCGKTRLLTEIKISSQLVRRLHQKDCQLLFTIHFSKDLMQGNRLFPARNQFPSMQVLTVTLMKSPDELRQNINCCEQTWFCHT